MITFEEVMTYTSNKEREERMKEAKNNEQWTLIDATNKHYNRWRNNKAGYVECFAKKENPNTDKNLQRWKGTVAVVVRGDNQ